MRGTSIPTIAIAVELTRHANAIRQYLDIVDDYKIDPVDLNLPSELVESSSITLAWERSSCIYS